MSFPTWTDEQVERLRDLCGSPQCGTSAWIARQMNDEFGTTYTRNAIIGKMGRCDIVAPRPLSAVKEKLIKKARKPKFNFARPAQVVIEDGPAIMPTEFPHKCDLFGLTNESCRWPCGNPGEAEFFFCGQPEADLLKRVPYCRAHMRASVSYRHPTG
jgi:GcrA cell cycle regulator